jgi:hypothetical protein
LYLYQLLMPLAIFRIKFASELPHKVHCSTCEIKFLHKPSSIATGGIFRGATYNTNT